MPDIVNELFPVPVEFVDGQQPTADFLNAWSRQIDGAFSLLGTLLGNFDGNGDLSAPFITNLTRAIGSMGEINTRLPRGLKRDDLTNPEIDETLAEHGGEKSALLTFMPKAVWATAASISYSNPLFVAQPTGAVVPTQSLTAAHDWVLSNRQIFTVDPIVATEVVTYEIDTSDVDRFKESYSQDSGPNVVPGIADLWIRGKTVLKDMLEVQWVDSTDCVSRDNISN